MAGAVRRVSQSSHFVLAKSDLGMQSSVLVSAVDGILDADTFVINQSVKAFFFFSREWDSLT